MATNLNLFFFGWAWNQLVDVGANAGQRNSFRTLTTQRNIVREEAGSFCFDICTDLCWHATPYNAMASGVGQRLGGEKKATALNSIMEWKKGKKVLSLFSKSQHMAFLVWLFKVFFSFRSAMAGKFMLIVMGKNLTQHPGARLSEDLNSKWNGRTGFFSSTQQLAADLETPLRCARRAIVLHLLLYDLGAVFRMHTPWHDYFRFWWSSVCVCGCCIWMQSRESLCFQDASWHELWWSLRLDQTQLLTYTRRHGEKSWVSLNSNASREQGFLRQRNRRVWNKLRSFSGSVIRERWLHFRGN